VLSNQPHTQSYILLICLRTGALAEDPKLLLLDELTTFLDVEDQFGVLEAVRAVTHTRRDVTAVWVTHRCAVHVLSLVAG
jgi:ABC-type cobalamin/Fe3+-siderophores transport system ATPase subunit